MGRTLKTKTLFSNSKNVDITSLIDQKGGKKNNNDKKNKNNDDSESEYEESVNDSEYGNSDDDNDENDDENDDSDEDNVNDDNVNDDNINDDDENDDDEKNDDKESINSDNDDNNSINDDKEKDYIDNEETLKTKCYSKYAHMDYDDIDFDELFGEETLSEIKNVRLTKPILTKYEFVRILTDRTKQLAQGAKPMLKNISGLSSKEIAKLELKNKIVPLIIERPIPNSNVERWKLSELEIPDYLFSN